MESFGSHCKDFGFTMIERGAINGFEKINSFRFSRLPLAVVELLVM